MKRIIMVELGGATFRVDEQGYATLRDYLARAESRLAGDADRAALLADLERAMGDKLGGPAAAERTLAATEVAAALGVRPSTVGAGPDEAVAQDLARRRRLYRIHDGKHVTGVCAGLAAYAAVDVAWVRALFVLLAVFTGGFFAVVYAVLVFLVPLARTPADIAAAQGRAALS
jgi:phage shock protein C